VTNIINMRVPQSHQLIGLDVRILSITILLSLVFFGRALVDIMFAFNLMADDFNASLILTLVYFLAEVIALMAVFRILIKRQK